MRKQKNPPILSKTAFSWTTGQSLCCFLSVPDFGCNTEKGKHFKTSTIHLVIALVLYMSKSENFEKHIPNNFYL